MPGAPARRGMRSLAAAVALCLLRLSGPPPCAAGRFNAALREDYLAGQVRLGRKYYHGDGVPRDDAKALSCFREAAEGGVPEGQFLLGVLYAEGRAVPQDFAEAARWYRKASDRRHGTACFNLAILYAGGMGLPRDTGEALRWYRRAAEAGHPAARVRVGAAFESGPWTPRWGENPPGDAGQATAPAGEPTRPGRRPVRGRPDRLSPVGRVREGPPAPSGKGRRSGVSPGGGRPWYPTSAVQRLAQTRRRAGILRLAAFLFLATAHAAGGGPPAVHPDLPGEELDRPVLFEAVFPVQDLLPSGWTRAQRKEVLSLLRRMQQDDRIFLIVQTTVDPIGSREENEIWALGVSQAVSARLRESGMREDRILIVAGAEDSRLFDEPRWEGFLHRQSVSVKGLRGGDRQRHGRGDGRER